MKAETKYFGEVEYTEEDILHFVRGMFGFEDEKRFLVLPFSEDRKLLCLQSLDTPALAFVMIDPFTLHTSYAPILQPDELKLLQVKTSHDLFFYALCAVKEPISSSTVNLKCPIAIHDEARLAMQVILEDNTFGMRHLLSEFEAQEESPEMQEELPC